MCIIGTQAGQGIPPHLAAIHPDGRSGKKEKKRNEKRIKKCSVPGYARRAATPPTKKLRVPKCGPDRGPAPRGRREERRREALELDWNFPPSRSRRPLSSHPVPVGRSLALWGSAGINAHLPLRLRTGITRLYACHFAETEGVSWLGFLIFLL